MILTVHTLAELRRGDRIRTVGPSITYTPPREVAEPLGPIEPGSPVEGVRLVNPDPASALELVLYPSQVDGLPLTIERG